MQEKVKYICGSPCLCSSSHKLPCKALVTLLQCRGFNEDLRGDVAVARVGPRPLGSGGAEAVGSSVAKGGGGGSAPPTGIGATGGHAT